MTAKEKAEELVRKYYTFGLNNPAQSFSWYECQQCAIIAIDELIYYAESKYQLDWFREIRNEIDKL